MSIVIRISHETYSRVEYRSTVMPLLPVISGNALEIHSKRRGIGGIVRCECERACGGRLGKHERVFVAKAFSIGIVVGREMRIKPLVEEGGDRGDPRRGEMDRCQRRVECL